MVDIVNESRYTENVTKREMTMLDQNFTNKMHYFAGVQNALNYDSVWSIYEVDHVDAQMLSDKPRRVFYRFYAKNATVEELQNGTAEVIEVSSLAVNGTVREMWCAAESCWQQAKAKGDWHYFIEDFVVQEDGSLKITMGS